MYNVHVWALREKQSYTLTSLSARSPVHNWLIPSQETNYDESHLISFFTFSYFDPKHWLVSLNLVGIIFRFLWCDWLIVFKWLGDSSDIVNESTAKNLTEKIEN